MKQGKFDAIKDMLPAAILLTVTFALFMPSSLFLGNVNEFTVDYYQVFPIVLLVTVTFFLVECLLGILLAKYQRPLNIYTDILFGIALGFYLQGNFFNGYLPKLDGGHVNWDNRSMIAIRSITVWSICLLVPQVASIFIKKRWRNFRKYGSGFLSAVQLLTLFILVITPGRTNSNSLALTKAGEFELGRENNIVVFIVDTLDAQWAEDYILDDPDYSKIVDDFIYFDNAVSGGAATVLGLPMLLTGVQYDNPHEIDLDTYYREAYGSSTLFKDLKAHGYGVRLFTNPMYLNHADYENIDNIVVNASYEISHPAKFATYLYELTSYYAMPYPFKKYFMLYSGDITSLTRVKGMDNGERFGVNDIRFYKNMNENGISIGNEEKIFVVYHLKGAHAYYIMDENCERVSKSKGTMEQQLRGTFKIISEYLDYMRELGLYDSSTIIITADHGGVDLYQNAAVFIKEPYQHNENGVVFNSAPITFQNVRASIASAFLTDYSAYGSDLFDDVSANIRNGRYHTAQSFLRHNVFPEKEVYWEYDEYIIGSPARDVDQIKELED